MLEVKKVGIDEVMEGNIDKLGIKRNLLLFLRGIEN